jgi:transcription antitermination factor NusG
MLYPYQSDPYQVVSQNQNDEIAPFSKWYALYTRSRCEKMVFQSLFRAKYHVFLPLIKQKRIWSDRIKTIAMPLLPSYVFVRAMASDLPKMLCFPGVVRFVSFNGKPSEVREKEINLLEAIIANGFPVENFQQCCVGDRVRIVRGPLMGWEGKVSRTQGSNKVMFQMESVGQVICVEVGSWELERL